MGEVATDTVLSVGAAAARLGVAPETLRSWGRRYGLMPSMRTDGGHRRYTSDDLALLFRMQQLVGGGVTPARAARAVQTPGSESDSGSDLVREAGPRRRPGGPGGRVLAVPGASAEVRGLARAASRLDAEALHGILGDLLAERGAIATWDQVLRPLLIAAGLRWAQTGEGIDIEHLLSESTINALRLHCGVQRRPLPGRPVLLSGSPEDLHVLPLHVIAAALAERRTPVRTLGARVPLPVLESAIRRTGASAVFLWRQLLNETDRLDLAPTRPPLLVVVGGPGWEGVDLAPGTRVAHTLAEAVDLLSSAPR